MIEKVCSVCGKIFFPGALHLYRAKGEYQCSYTCYRKAGGDTDKKKNKGKISK